MQHDLDFGVGEQLGQRRHVDPVQAVDQEDPRPARCVRVIDRDLREAQQCPVAALGHEFRVDPQPPPGARQRGRFGDLARTR